MSQRSAGDMSDRCWARLDIVKYNWVLSAMAKDKQARPPGGQAAGPFDSDFATSVGGAGSGDVGGDERGDGQPRSSKQPGCKV